SACASSVVACASSVVDPLMVVAPGLQTGINALRVRIHTCPWNDSVFHERFDRLLLDIGQQIDHDLTTALQHPKDGRPCLLHGPSASFALEPTSTSWSALALHHLRLAFMPRHHIGFVALHFV